MMQSSNFEGSPVFFDSVPLLRRRVQRVLQLDDRRVGDDREVKK